MPHYDSVDPADEWQKGVIGFLTRYRGIATSAASGVSSSALSWLNGYIPLAVVLGVSSVVVVASLVWTRHYFMKRIKSEDRLHAFHHQLRDSLAKIVGSTNQQETLAIIDGFNKQAAQGIADFFKIRCGDAGINCAIRLAELEPASGQEVYCTRARSSGMDPGRETATVAIRNDEGIARAMLGRGKRGVYIIPSIEEAIQENIWVANPNDRKTDVRSLMVAPINGWRGGQRYMLGILFVTTPAKNGGTFCSVDSLPLKAFADSLGLAYAVIWDRITQTPLGEQSHVQD